MQEMKDKIILKILVQESLKLELWLKRYDKKCLGGLFGISGKWLGLYLEIQSESRGSVWNFCGLLLDSTERQGVPGKVAGIFWLWNYF
jgi:hypothetical protein